MSWSGRYRPHPTAPPLSQEDGASKGKSPYRRGYEFEVSILGQLRRRGYFAIRSGASKGKIDILATGKATAAIGISGLFIQAKRTGSISSAEWNEVYDIAQAAGGWAVICYRPSPRKTSYMRLDARREFRKPGRPWSAFDPATCVVLPITPTLPLR